MFSTAHDTNYADNEDEQNESVIVFGAMFAFYPAIYLHCSSRLVTSSTQS